MMRYSTFSKVPNQEPYDQMHFNVIHRRLNSFKYCNLTQIILFSLVRLFGFYGISTFIGYLMPNPFFLQINSSISNNSV